MSSFVKTLRRPYVAASALIIGLVVLSMSIVLRPQATTIDLAEPASLPATSAPTTTAPTTTVLERRIGEPAADALVDDLPEAPPAIAFIDRSPSNAPNPTARQNPNSSSTAETTVDRLPAADSPISSEQPRTVGATAPASTTEPATPDTPRTTTPTTPATAAPTSAAPSSTPPTTATTTIATPTTATPTTATPTTATPTTTAPTTTAPTTAAPRPVGTRGAAGYIAPSAPTYIPVYDTAWQMLVRSTPAQADNYFAALKANGFSGAWSGIIHHAPATYNLNFAGGGQVGSMQNGELILSDAYIAHARQILDAANRHGMKVGLVAAWQNLYLPGGGADNGVGTSNAVRGTITTANAYAYGRHIAEEFGDHPAVSMWVFGGDAGTNNTNANKAVWREMARGVRDAGNGLSITYHTPTSEFDQLNYVGEPWLDFVAPETGHAQDAPTTEAELRSVKAAYGTPVWQGEPRYFNINFDWVNAAFRNPGVAEVQADAQAAENAGVSGYVYGDAGRWTWCAGFGDSSPCNPNNVAASFGAGEQAVIDVFRN